MKVLFPDKNRIKLRYNAEEEVRNSITHELEVFLEKSLGHLESHFIVKARPKNFESYFKKYIIYLRNQDRYKEAVKNIAHIALKLDPEPFIPDQIGLRIICPFIEDIEEVTKHCKAVFDVLEVERKGSNYSFKEFGYESIHLLVSTPSAILKKYPNCPPGLTVAEVQVRTILQDAWAEVEHELVYKAEFTPFDERMKRKLAALNASLSLADTIFQEIRTYQRQLRMQLDQRHSSFFKQIGDTVDRVIPDRGLPPHDAVSNEAVEESSSQTQSQSLDDLLLNGLYAHNKREFEKAIEFYSAILGRNQDDRIQSLVHRHRGMAFFATSRYKDALADFGAALDLDATSYKAVYYTALVLQVLEDYSGAVDGFSKSLEIHPYQPYCLFRRAQAYFHLGDYPAALADCESALAVYPELPGAAEFKRLILEKLEI
jgi:putative GTP pyrophosphokinase